jgi:DNA-binding transcriptional MerR regulator
VQPTYHARVARRDPAFLWETEVLRSFEPRPGSNRREEVDGGDWLTVKEANDTTGIPTSTIRKWARNENIPSFMERTEGGFLRMVSLSGIRQRAAELGRELEGGEESLPGDGRSESPETADPSVPEGTMLVPLDAWNRLLNQLGNLHDAGQQLAEARERAAKAETESRFLKERLAELRDELDTAREKATARSPDDSTDGPFGQQSSPTSLVRSIYKSWRAGRRRGS